MCQIYRFICQSILFVFFLFPVYVYSAQDKVVTVYSYRQTYLVESLMTKFEEATGFIVDFKYLHDEIPDLLATQGENAKADVLLVTGMGQIYRLMEQGLLRPVSSIVLEQNIPNDLRDKDNFWFGLTLRARLMFLSNTRFKKQPLGYEDLAKSKFKGRVCMRDFNHPYNIDLLTALVADMGESKTKQWLEGVKNNLARRPQGNDRDQIRAIGENICDVTVANSYYYWQMQADPIQKKSADKVWVIFPNQTSRGTHMNISGVAMARYAKNIKGAQALMEYLSMHEAQSEYAKLNFEHPVNPRASLSQEAKSWGKFKMDYVRMEAVAKYEKVAERLLETINFDQ